MIIFHTLKRHFPYSSHTQQVGCRKLDLNCLHYPGFCTQYREKRPQPMEALDNSELGQSPVRSSPGTSRSSAQRGQIPGTLVFNWQPTDSQGTRSLVRRPITACQPCRAARAKCKGTLPCARCRARGISCKNITQVGHRYSSASNRLSGHTVQSVEPALVENPAVSIVLGSPVTSSTMTLESASPHMIPPLGSEIKYSGEALDSALEQFDWTFCDDIDFEMDTINVGPSSTSSPNTRQEIASTSTAPIIENYHEQGRDASLPPIHCPCRTMLMAQIPKIESCVQDKLNSRLDKMLKATADVISSCTSAAKCANCQLSPVDLVCVLTVFQQTAFCFNRIAQSEFRDENVKINVGDYEVRLYDDHKFQNALILNLVEQADAFLDILESHSKTLLLAQSSLSRKVMSRSPGCLNQLNLDYAQVVISNFRKLFRLITARAQDK
ncbi:hypothetical protein BX600DRAFT_471665 [Xylariales sp. PMI_506]|nr:hypothetical protein BX600DRAFT_471665 [Xylariales sp. PMI_506]